VIITKLKFGGNQLNRYKCLSPKAGLSIASQLIASIAIAEEELEFEHRDLHSSNILIDKTNEEFAKYCINDNPFCIKLNGYFVIIIDTTFSRSTFNNEIAFNNLTRLFSNLVSNEKRELDRIYFEEKVLTQNKWDSFCPKTNLLWVKQILTAIRVKVEKSEFNRNCESMADYELIKKWESNALNYSSVSEFGQNCCALYRKSKPKKYFLIAFLRKSKKQIDNRSKLLERTAGRLKDVRKSYLGSYLH
jgi:serine/threonine-protein kinase haspin